MRDTGRGSGTPVRAVLVQVVVVVLGVLLYFGARGLTDEDRVLAVRNARRLVGWETSLGLYHEPTVQNFVDQFDHVVTVMNWVYIWGHWPVIAVILLWLVVRHPEGYRVTRDAMLLSGSIGLVAFVLFPVAPPRLAGLGLTDTVTERSVSYRVLQPQAFVNQYAAMPSLHVGWDLLIGIGLVTYAGARIVRMVGMVLPVLMLVAVVATANHYLVDAVAGIALVLACRAVAIRFERRRVAGRARPTDGARIPRPRRAPEPTSPRPGHHDVAAARREPAR